MIEIRKTPVTGVDDLHHPLQHPFYPLHHLFVLHPSRFPIAKPFEATHLFDETQHRVLGFSMSRRCALLGYETVVRGWRGREAVST